MEKKIPNHIAIILDGNGRWAKKRMLPRSFGHRQGAKNVEKICEVAYNLGVNYLTVYAFSTENWKRPKKEVDLLMDLLKNYLDTYQEKAMSNNMKVNIIGDRRGFRDDIKESIEKVEKITQNNTGLNFIIALNYGGRDEIIRAIKSINKDVKCGNIKVDELNETIFENYLDTKNIPQPDLIIRTSGEQRLSNFLIWQSSYSELYFTDVLWPDFNEQELKKAIEDYSKRNRRFGGI